MAVLNTRAIVDFSRSRRNGFNIRAGAVVRTAVSSDERLWTTRFNLAGLYAGLGLSTDADAERIRIARVMEGVGVLEFTGDAARCFASVSVFMRRLGRPIGDFDCLMVGVAVAHGERLMTRNLRRFADIPALVVRGY